MKPVLDELIGRYRPVTEGSLAAYIPELARANPADFAIAVATTDGEVHEAGDSVREFTLQSLSKPFVYGLTLEDHGRERLRAQVGVEPTGDAFNSIIELERHSHRPYNPMINSGAIAVTSLLKGDTAGGKFERILELFARYVGKPVRVDEQVFASERATGHRNRAIAHLLRNFGVLGEEGVGIDEALDLYFRQCSILTNTRDLALMGATLANGGVQPLTRERAIAREYVRDLLSLMFSCGMYDAAGEWAYTVGLPAKSGVSGGILAVVPGRMGIAVYSPLLDSRGHSVRGTAVCRELSERFRLHAFEA